MAIESQINILKKLFLNFFIKWDIDYWNKQDSRDYERRRDRKGKPTAEELKKWRAYQATSKTVILGLAATVTSLVGVIGQPGVDAFNTWLTTYASGTGALTNEAVAALQKWYDQYLKSLS